MLISAGLPMRQHFRNLGMEPRKLAERTVKLQDEIFRDVRAAQPDVRLRGIANPQKGFGPRILDFVHPPGGEDDVSPLHKAVLGLWHRGALLADRALA